jgi:hypothetical protein
MQMICYFINEAAPGLFAMQFDAEWEEKGSQANPIANKKSNDLQGIQACKNSRANTYAAGTK